MKVALAISVSALIATSHQPLLPNVTLLLVDTDSRVERCDQGPSAVAGVGEIAIIRVITGMEPSVNVSPFDVFLIRFMAR